MFRLTTQLGNHLRNGHTLLVPAQQPVRGVQLAYAAAQLAGGAHVWASPDVLTWSAWVRRECERHAERSPQEWPRVLGAAAEWVLWRDAARTAARDCPLLDTDALAESLWRASERATGYGVRLTGRAPNAEARLLFEAQRIFAARCRDVGAASVSALAPRLHDIPRARALLLRGFGVLSPQLAALAAGSTAGNLGAPARTPAPAVPRGVRTADAESQLEAIATWCRERLAAQPDARLLVMLPGPAGARERLAALIRTSLDPGAALAGRSEARTLVALEEGQPFGAIAPAAQALLSFNVLAGSEIDLEGVSRWLMAPCWGAPRPAPRAALALLLRERGPARLNLRELLGALQLVPRELRPAARELDGLLRQAATRLGEGNASPRRWAERFEAALAVLTWPGPVPEGSALQQMRLRWRELLDEFGELAASAGSLHRDAAVELLQALALRTAYRSGDEDAPVTLSPLLTDPVVSYDGIWVGSLAADVLPQPVAPDPFLPLHAQLEAHVPEASVAGRRAQAVALLEAWRAATEDLVLSVPAREKDQELLPSPLLSDVALQGQRPASLWLPLRLHRAGGTEALEDARGTAFNALTPLPGGSRALVLQNDCPFRAYAELRLGALAPEEVQPGVPMDQRGLLLHGALQALWERLRNSQALGALGAQALDALIGECVTQAARGLQAEQRGRPRRPRHAAAGQIDLFAELSPALARECRRAQALIRRLCELERTRAPFTVEATEHITELALGGGRLRLRLDRVDAIAGGLAVLDYKSGRPVPAPDWYGERPTHPQLLAYLTALGSDVVALATVNLTAREVRFSGVAAVAGLLPQVQPLPAATGAAADWGAQRRSWQGLIERLIRAFLSGEARVDPVPGACDYCHVSDICRIGAHLSPEPPGHADEADE